MLLNALWGLLTCVEKKAAYSFLLLLVQSVVGQEIGDKWMSCVFSS